MGPAKDEKPAFDAARVQLEHSLARAAVTPALTAVFGGVVQPKRLRFPFSWMPASDARDWAAIESFAKQAADLAGSRAATDGT
jgi:menaquinone-dependent protoporphyrinogen IX oxidase